MAANQIRRPPESTTRNQGNVTLQGWKEIGQYLGRGVRTVQRWERNLQFPVGRIGNHSVYAYTAKVDAWLRSFEDRRPRKASSMSDRTWRDIAEMITKERDPEKVITLVEELNRRLGEQQGIIEKQNSGEPHFIDKSASSVGDGERDDS